MKIVMEKYSRISVRILLSLISFFFVFIEGYSVRNMKYYTIKNGLSSNAIYSITQDSKGIMWFGTIDGLHSFDGSKIKPWRNSSIITLGPKITSIHAEDSKLYVGSDQGLSIFNLHTESFSVFDKRTKYGENIRSTVTHIICDRNGYIWIGTTRQGVFCYSPGNDELRQYPALSKIGSDWVTYLLEDSDKNILAATKSEGIWKYNPLDDNFLPYINTDVEIRTLFEDKHKNLWIGGWSKGLFEVDKESNTLIQKVKPNSLKQPLQVRKIIEWEDNSLLFASDEGLTIYSIDDGNYQFIKIGNDNINLNDNYLHSLFVDNEKGLWIGTYFGGINYVPHQKEYFEYHQPYKNGLNARIVSVLADAYNGNLWIGTDDAGVFYWERDKNIFRSYSSFAKGKQTSYHNIHAILNDGDKLFIGMYMNGIDILDFKTGIAKNYKHSTSNRSLYSSDIYAIYKDSEDNIWIGTTGGLNRYVDETDDFERILDVSMTDVSYITEDLDNNLWVCSHAKGVFTYDRKTKDWKHFFHKIKGESGILPVNNINTACVDNKGNMWLGSDGAGLIKYDARNSSFLKVKLPEHIRVINKIITDARNVWFTTSNGLFCYNDVDKSLKSYNENDGLQDNMFMPNSGIKLDDGNICIGGINGFNEFNPAKVPAKTALTNVILTDFYLFNKPLDISSEESPLRTSITYAKELILTHEQSVFSFSVVIPSYSNPTGNVYSYKLDGFDEDWIETSYSPRVTYTNLPSGDYVFRVKVANPDGVWYNDAIAFPIKILPPWWLSIYMIIAYVICLLGGVIYLYYRQNRKHQQKIMMLTIEKDKEIYQSKIEFFTHIMHEIRTPLTLILAPLENVMRSEGSIQDAMPQLRIIEKNGKRLLNLVNQLMDFRKIESGKMELNLQSYNLKPLVESVYQRFLPLAEIKNITIKISLSECYGYVDSEAFVKIVSNLLTNALKYTSTYIWINMYVNQENYIVLQVKDNGQGIIASDHEKIFQPFYQSSSNGKSTDNIGTGVGLSLVKKLVEQMDGRLKLESEFGNGALFTVLIKVAEQRNADLKPVVETEVAEQLNIIESEGEDNYRNRILIVDDNPDIIEFLTTVLLKYYNVDSASNGAEALKILNKQVYDLVISDVMMPVMNGIELCRKIKNNISTSHIPVILLTAKATKDDYVEGLESGADVYIEKPFSEDVLRAQIKSLFVNREKARKDFNDMPNSSLPGSITSKVDIEFMQKISEIIDKHIVDSDFSVDILAQEVGISRSGLFVKIKAVAGMTPNDYIRLIRLKMAARLLKEEGISSSEACYRVGFSSPSYFSQCFQKQFGVSPKEYKNL